MSKVPHHLGIILDGNRRWANERNLSPFEGHKKGSEVVQKAITWCKERGIKILTLFVFSTENWSRPKEEINYLMKLLKQIFAKKNVDKTHKENIKIRIIGQTDRFGKSFQGAIKNVEELTKNNNGMVLNFALSYGGRAEIVQAIKNIIKNKIPPEKINEEVIKDNLWTSDVDLVIRTGKEQRISNFLIWQTAYSELYFPQKYWPDFTEQDLDEAIAEYNQRQRRFGK